MELVGTIKQLAMDAIENSKPSAIFVGMVVDVSPLKIAIDQKLILDEDFLLLTTSVSNYKTKVKIGNAMEECQIYNGLKNGEKVILLREQGGQNYIVIDRYGGDEDVTGE